MNTAPTLPPHVCRSGSPYCSGTSPCPPCFILVRAEVASKALADAGYSGQVMLALVQCVAIMRQNGAEPSQLGIQLPPFASPEEQHDAFLDAYTMRFRALHERIETDGAFRAQFVIADVTGAVPSAAAGSQQPAASQSENETQAASVVAKTAEPVIARQPQTNGHALAVPPEPSIVDEIAATVVPAEARQAPPVNGPVVLGDVVHLPPTPPSSNARNGVG